MHRFAPQMGKSAAMIAQRYGKLSATLATDRLARSVVLNDTGDEQKMRVEMKNRYFFASVITLVLTACGGGGGGGGGGSSGLLPPLAITSSNYVGVATNSVAQAGGASSTSSLGTNLVGAQISQSESIDLKNIALSTATTLLDNWAMFDNPTIVGAVTSKTVSCTGGGTVSAVTNASNSLAPTAGDTVSATFTNCNLNGLLGNGSVSIVVNSYSGNLSTSGSASLTMKFNNFTAGSNAIDGSMTLGVTISSATVSNVTLAMPNFLVTTNGDSFTFDGFSLTVSKNSASTSYTMAGTISSSKFGGSVVMSTPTTFAIDSSNRATGEILITGKNGTKARIVGQRTSIILVEADTTGNGTYDTKTTVTLASLGL